MIIHLARDAFLCLRGLALFSPMVVCTVAMFVVFFDALLSEVVPPLALETANWFALEFF